MYYNSVLEKLLIYNEVEQNGIFLLKQYKYLKFYIDLIKNHTKKTIKVYEN